ncbi:hypothetical protein D046_6800B, partial [Vibrio parahaemolyticus V-223/04]
FVLNPQSVAPPTLSTIKKPRYF